MVDKYLDMTDFDKQRVENAIWVLEQYKEELIGMTEFISNKSPSDVTDALELLKEIKKYVVISK